jgi:riboflavin biosynthesis pyrimidine reductase
VQVWLARIGFPKKVLRQCTDMIMRRPSAAAAWSKCTIIGFRLHLLLDLLLRAVLPVLLLLTCPCGCRGLSLLRGVTLKIAVDANGGVAEQARTDATTTKKGRFTCPAALDMVHRLRRDADAILVGKRTVMDDNPSLLVRQRGSVVVDGERQPLRVILDTNLSLLRRQPPPLHHHQYQVFTDGYPTLVYHHASSSEATAAAKDTTTATTLASIDTITINDDSNDEGNNNQNGNGDHGRRVVSIPHVWHDLQTRYNVQHLMVEGGPAVARAFLYHRLVDRCLVVRATTVTFAQPLPSNIDEALLSAAGLTRLGRYPLGVDEVECWSRNNNNNNNNDNAGWPTKVLSDWP